MERRSSLREPVEPDQIVTIYLVRPEGKYTKHQIKPQDFSAGGLGFDHDAPLDLGRHVEFEIRFKGEKKHAIGKVIRCEQRGEKFNIGIQFDQVLPGLPEKARKSA
jgi:hypothetical protein